MIGLDNFLNYIFNKKDFANLNSIKFLLNNMDKMKTFYCDIDYSKVNNNFTMKEKIINIPFQNIWIENPKILIDGFEIIGIGIFEENPEKQICYFSAKNKNNYSFCGSFSINPDYLGFGNVGNIQVLYEKICNGCMEWLLFFENIIDNRNNIIFLRNDEKTIKKGRIGREYKKVKYSPSELIYISTNTNKIKKDENFKSRIIAKPQYAFEVRGHWRKINTIGKDRTGKRTINGYTWVIPYTKNNDKELMKKIRVVKTKG